MNPWIVAASLLAIALVPCGIVMVRKSTADGLVALELAGTITCLCLLALAEGLRLSYLFDVALTLAVLSYPAGLVFAHFLERWL
ncbi:MAG TPA: monovalent cation/H+ antiporter complex subunit F [Isosphaeraceae bacterium]|jgi:multicomponent Na+:H+ antiporter subunit F|nr:monovalent cation/H+ antiporter complex subunit F [Isosphaeraceae bacterium]